MVKVEFEDIGPFIDDFIKIFGNARVPLTSVLTYWHKWNKINIFGLKGPGKYADLSEGYKAHKRAVWGFVYPILKASGTLEQSITTPNSPYSVAELTEDSLTMGTTVPYAIFLQRGTKQMPSRPPIIKTEKELDAIANIFFQSAIKMFNNVKGVH